MRRLMILLVILLAAGAGLAIAQTGDNNNSVKSYLDNVSTQFTSGIKDVTTGATTFGMPCAQTGSGMPCAQASSGAKPSK